MFRLLFCLLSCQNIELYDFIINKLEISNNQIVSMMFEKKYTYKERFNDIIDKIVDIEMVKLNDRKENWEKAVKTDSLSNSHNYFIENGNVSKVVEDLGIKTIPHYLIYNPNGELINGFANRPGKGANEQLRKLITKK